ncbi:MAG: HD domain-containing protein [Bulleidia sp.]|nr:HD domain-containing protein [Bulleidia sp.]
MVTVAELTKKMIDFYEGNHEDIAHFLKVWAYARTIGQLENLDSDTQLTLEMAAVVHDISCPTCRRKYGDTAGNHQEAESEALLRDFLADSDLDEARKERIIFIVCHHHTYTGVEGLDWQILLEADYLVNASENPEKYLPGFDNFRKNVYKTKTGLALLDSVFPHGSAVDQAGVI